MNGNQFWCHLIAICLRSHAQRTSSYSIQTNIILRGEQISNWTMSCTWNPSQAATNTKQAIIMRSMYHWCILSTATFGHRYSWIMSIRLALLFPRQWRNNILITSWYWPVQSFNWARLMVSIVMSYELKAALKLLFPKQTLKIGNVTL